MSEPRAPKRLLQDVSVIFPDNWPEPSDVFSRRANRQFEALVISFHNYVEDNVQPLPGKTKPPAKMPSLDSASALDLQKRKNVASGARNQLPGLPIFNTKPPPFRTLRFFSVFGLRLSGQSWVQRGGVQGDRGCFEALNKKGLGSPNKIGGSTEPRFAHAFFVLCVWPAASRGRE